MCYQKIMNKKKLLYYMIIIFLFNSCISLHICNVGFEKPENFKINLESNIKPSEIIFKYTNDSSYLKRKNYFLTFFDVCCGSSKYNVNHSNSLYNDYKEYYSFIAFTYPSLSKVNTLKNKGNTNYDLEYNYPEYYDINGLSSSLLNLYYKNEPWLIATPHTIIVANDTVIYHLAGPIYYQERYESVKNTLDSVLVANNYFME